MNFQIGPKIMSKLSGKSERKNYRLFHGEVYQEKLTRRTILATL
jgi:hypothetical protein